MAEPAESSATPLTDAIKDEIQSAYRAWLAGRGFKPRWGQRQMIADIARTLTSPGNRLSVVEAGTGTGKTVAYCLAVIPIAKAMDKRVVIATATVALQEQVVLRDLPDLQRHGQLDFTFTLAKGRARYVCLKRLEDRIAFNADLEGQLFDPPNAADLSIYARLQSAFGNGSWDGERDSWAEGLDASVWMPITNDRAGCSAGRCTYYHQCPFFRARRQAGEADVVVANHDLVLADTSLGGGVVLPAMDETILVLDEAHHLPEKTREHFTASVRLRASTEWLAQMSAGLETMARRFRQPREVARAINRLNGEAGDLARLLADMELLVRGLPFPTEATGRRDERRLVHRFPLGEVPQAIADLAGPLGQAFGAAAAILNELLEALTQVIEGSLDWDNAEQVETWLPTIAQLAGRAEAGATLFRDYAAAADAERMAARWVTRLVFDSFDDLELTSAPLDPGHILKETLWENCYGAVATSATLCALGDFERFMASAGITAEARQLRIRSPFDFPRIAVFSVPAMHSEPRDSERHTEEVAALLPELLALERSALALFTSWRLFNAVVNSLPADLRERCQVQDTASKQHLLNEHRHAIDAGEPSYLFGLASFAEGVDLPGDYCRHVILAKLPFAAPDDPVDEALSEWLQSQGRNPFMEIALPEASLRLVQACGRLIRHETDGGRITLLDRRIVTKRYGEALLDALPPYRREIG